MNGIIVSEINGSGADAHRSVSVEGVPLTLWTALGDDEPRMRDIDVAVRLGYSQPRDVRKLVERIWPENKRPYCRATTARQPVGRSPRGRRGPWRRRLPPSAGMPRLRPPRDGELAPPRRRRRARSQHPLARSRLTITPM